MSRNRNRDQQIWVEYELFKEDWKGEVTSEQLFQFLAKRHFSKENPESACAKVKKIVENMRKAGKKYHPSLHQPMTKIEAAEYLGVSISTIDRLRKRGDLKSQSSRDTRNFGGNSGGRVFFHKQWLDEYLLDQK